MKPTIYKAECIGSGSLNLMAKPVAGEWIEQEFAGIRAFGIDRIVSLLERAEAWDLGLGKEQTLAQQNAMDFVSFPIRDMSLPTSIRDFAVLTKHLHSDCEKGINTVVHCRAGIGRTGMVAAGILLHCGYSADEAFARLSAKRGITMPDTPEQAAWVSANAKTIINTC